MAEEYIFMKNPGGRVVEVEESQKEKLLKKGFEVVREKPRELRQINLKKADFDMPINIRYHYDGYGRLGNAIKDRLRFDKTSNIKVFLGRPSEHEKASPDEIHILFTMFEADKLPDRWVEDCNKADGIIVPSEWCKKVFKDSGVTTPIEVVNLGTDCFEPTEPDTKPFIFAHQNAFVDGDQKGWQLVMKTFKNAFKDKGPEDVQLILKGRKHRWANDNYWIKLANSDPKITAQVEDLSDMELEEWWEQINCFVYPSKGEGFGLPPLEAMARGIPTILTDAHSMTEFSEYGYTIGTRGKVPSYYVGRVWQRGIGYWVEPDHFELEDKMIEVYEKYKIIKNAFIQQIPELEEKFSWDVMIENLEEAVEKLAND